jgi:acyl-coenzyme A thioesterase PaaI-like protein
VGRERHAGDVARRPARFLEQGTRPGGTISGPTLMAMALTTNLDINFMRKPDPGHLMGERRRLRPRQDLAVGGFSIWNEGGKDPVACHGDLFDPAGAPMTWSVVL